MYHFVLDCIVIAGVDVTFDLLHRRDATDTVITTWTEHFNPLPTSFDAQAYEINMPGVMVPFIDGDKLVFRFSGANTIQSDAWIPNGDGTHSDGRIPNITLPK
jgi:hypothetical protein